MYRTDFWTLWEKARVGCFERTALKHVYYLGWNRSPAQAGCMRQGAGALGRPRGIGWRGRWEVGSGWGIHINPWLIHVNVWQKPLQYYKVISLQLIKINERKRKQKTVFLRQILTLGLLVHTSVPLMLNFVLCFPNFQLCFYLFVFYVASSLVIFLDKLCICQPIERTGKGYRP